MFQEQAYVDELADIVHDTLRDDLLGMYLIGSAAQGAYEAGVSDIDVMAVSENRHDKPIRRRLGERLMHPNLTCPAAGLEFVWYALPDLERLANPVEFQLNVNGGPDRGSLLELAPSPTPNYWSVLDLAAARHVGMPLVGPPPAEVIPPVPHERIIDAVRLSLAWHDEQDAGSPNRVLNLARMIVLLDDDRWVSKPDGARIIRDRHPELAPAIDEALAARAHRRWMDAGLAARLSEMLRDRLGPEG